MAFFPFFYLYKIPSNKNLNIQLKVTSKGETSDTK